MEYKHKIVVYIAGPYKANTTYKITQNIQQAESLAIKVWKEGFTALCPHKNTGLFDGECLEELYLKGGLELLRRSDVVLVLTNWENSSGTKKEIAEAKKKGIPVFYNLQQLINYYKIKK